MKTILLATMAALLTSVCAAQQNYYDVTAGGGYGLRLWGANDSWKVHMGNSSEYHYGPVTDYSIKTNMDGISGRGWTWGGQGATPVAALDNTGRMQIAGYLNSRGLRIPGRYVMNSSEDAGIELELPANEFNAIRGVVGSTTLHTIHFFENGWGAGSPSVSSGCINLNPSVAVTLGYWNNPAMYVRKSDGYVGVGTVAPDARLAVKGQVHAQEVKVDLNGGIAPDYVFEKKYALASLEDVKSYIDQHKHLPEVPSGKELETNGINVGEMNLLLLKKIEELTLYVIDLKKQIDVQQEEINQLANSKK